MKIGILSDTHNDRQTTQAILHHFREEKIQTVFHCGDVTSPEMISLFNGFTLHLAFGNADYLTGAIHEKVLLLGTDSTARRKNIFTLNDQKILILHGNFENELQTDIKSQTYDMIFTGHTHARENKLIDSTSLFNPGAASRSGDPPFSYGIYDFQHRALFFHQTQS